MNKKLKYSLLIGIPILIFLGVVAFFLLKPKVVKPPLVPGVPEDVLQVTE
jgi:hypothetical protein